MFGMSQTGVNPFMHNVKNNQKYFKTLRCKHGTISTICLKELTEHYLNQAFIPVKSKCWMTEWSIWVKIVSFVLMECNDDLNLFQSFIILLLLAPSHISEIPKGKIQFFLQLNPVHVLLQHHHQFFEMICFAVKFWRHKQAK